MNGPPLGFEVMPSPPVKVYLLVCLLFWTMFLSKKIPPKTKNLSTDADSRTVTVSERLHDLSLN